MTMTREQVRERMIEYLYGELEGEELRAFEEQLRASDDDRRELAALQATLGSVREGLAHAADEAPPARVRQAVLAAAVAHAPRARAPRWLRTSFVVVPALAVAAAALLVVLNKKIEPPRVHVEDDSARSRLEPSAPPPSAAAPAALESADKGEAPTEVRATSSAPGTGAAHRKTASPPSAAVPVKAARRPAADTQFAEPPPAWNRARQPPSAAEPSAAPAADTLRERSSNAAPAPEAARGGQQEDRAVREAEATQVAPTTTSAAQEAKSVRAAAKPASAAEAPSSLGAVSPSAAPAAPAAPNFPASTIALERRARDHFTARRWPEAAADYRELLRREPTSPRAAEWKKQLTLATRSQPRSE